MFSVIYIYRVPQKNVDEFLRIQKAAGEIYRDYGSLEEETLALTNLEAKYGCAPFLYAVEVEKDEDIFVSLSRFRDKAHHDHVMAQIDSDTQIDRLYQEITGLIDIRRVLRGEFERVI